MHFCMIIPKDEMGLDDEETFKLLVPPFLSTLSVKRNDPTRSLLASKCSPLSPWKSSSAQSGRTLQTGELL